MREGEETIVDIYNRLKDGFVSLHSIFKDIPGVASRDREGNVVRSKERALIPDLDVLPLPDISLVDYTKYRRVYNPNKHQFQHIY